VGTDGQFGSVERVGCRASARFERTVFPRWETNSGRNCCSTLGRLIHTAGPRNSCYHINDLQLMDTTILQRFEGPYPGYPESERACKPIRRYTPPSMSAPHHLLLPSIFTMFATEVGGRYRAVISCSVHEGDPSVIIQPERLTTALIRCHEI
jgi:hypothetical protein